VAGCPVVESSSFVATPVVVLVYVQGLRKRKNKGLKRVRFEVS